MKTIVFQGLIVGALGLATATVGAQPAAPEAPPAPAPPALQEMERLTEPPSSEQQENFHRFQVKRREKLIQMLQLDEATRTKMLQRLEQLDQKAEDLRRQRREALVALRQYMKAAGPKRERKSESDKAPAASNTDEAGLRSALDRVYTVEGEIAALHRDRLQVARDLLTPEQQVKFLMYRLKFQKEMRERFHSGQGGRKGKAQEGQEQGKP